MPFDPRMDAYIAKAKPFARPILEHIRAAVRAGCPDVEETIKWGMPSFYHKGPLCGMAAFKEHATFGFWKHSLLSRRLPKAQERAMGSFGKLTSLSDLPSRARLVSLVRAAVKLNDDGVKVVRRRKPRPPVNVPAFFTAALGKNPKALTAFHGFPPSHKRDETRAKRLAQAVEWIAQGKSRNWKYER